MMQAFEFLMSIIFDTMAFEIIQILQVLFFFFDSFSSGIFK
jgi:hypothetical protein